MLEWAATEATCVAACSEGTRSRFTSCEAARTRLVASLSNGIALFSRHVVISLILSSC